jgi:hypothetical protein
MLTKLLFHFSFFLFKNNNNQAHRNKHCTQEPPPPPPQTMDVPRDHYMEALHPTRPNQWKYHWFDPDYPPPPEAWKRSCNDKGCGHWSRCYECNDSMAILLVDKAEFLARKELEKEYPETPHPNPPSLRPHRFRYGTDPNKTDPELIKWNNWRLTKDRRITTIALDIAADPTKTSNKEDLATTGQVKTELTHRRYYYHTYLDSLTPENKENNPPPQKKSNKRTATSPPPQELFPDTNQLH